MTNQHELTVNVAGNGHVFVTQGYYNQAFYIAREVVPRFLADPESAAIVLIPHFAATVLSCYVTGVKISAINLKRDLAISDEFSFAFDLPSRRVGYYTEVDILKRPQWLARQHIDIAVTPQALGIVNCSGTIPTVSIVAGLRRPERPDYSARFAFNPSNIRDALADAVSRQRNQNHERRTTA